MATTEKDFELEKLRHNNKLEEIEKEYRCKLDLESIKHNNFLEGQRIRGAEIKKTIDRKARLMG